MRILHILDHSIPLHSEYAVRTQAILKHQRALGWETFHLTGPKQGAVLSDEESVGGWEFSRTAPQSGLLENVPVLAEIELMGEITFGIEKIVKRVRPHILHAHSPVLNALPALRAGRRSGTPVVYEVRALWEDAGVVKGTVRRGGVRYRLMRGVETWALKHADAVTTICEGLRGDIVARGISAEKVTVIPNAVDIEDLPVVGKSALELKRQLGLEGALVIGFVGALHEFEGLEVLLRAVPKILSLDAQVRVLLVGDGPHELKLRQLAAELQISDRIVFAGQVPHEDLARYYGAFDLHLSPRLPMRYTDLVTPMQPLEVMARGCLLVASDVGGSRETVRHGETGILFKAGDVDALAAAVINLVHAQDSWPVLRAAARRFVETERTWAASVSQYENVYARVTNQSWRT
jgi:PEP-CTERM/exosortase A-associated glycosyltransferase